MKEYLVNYEYSLKEEEEEEVVELPIGQVGRSMKLGRAVPPTYLPVAACSSACARNSRSVTYTSSYLVRTLRDIGSQLFLL